MQGTLSALFLICFFAGAGLTALSLVTGASHLPLPGAHALHFGHIGHFGHGLHLGHVGHGAHAATSHSAGKGAAAFNLSSILAFLTWFGGIGYLLLSLSPLRLLLIIAVAAAAGLIGAGLIALFLIKVLMPAETVVDPEVYRMDGTRGRITAGILTGGTGEITYSKAGTRRADAARSIDGEPIARNEEVVILSYRRGIAYVQTLKRYLHSSAAEVAARLASLDEDDDRKHA